MDVLLAMAEQYEYEWDGTTPLSVAVIEAISQVSGKGLRELDPLHSAIDPDALDAIFRSRGQPAINQNIEDLTFHYEECKITVSSSGRIVIEPPT